jgi:phosphopantothenoylcysteine decarboxylase/phosphopantothenate--cysteine ligase
MIGKIALGLADDLLSTTLMSCESPCCLAPAMNFRMLANPAVQANMETLRNRGFHVIEPVVGLLANGEFGEGRMESPDRITQVIAMLADSRKDMKGRRVMISAGPTVEALDPVRYITNRSSGKMGFALAQMAARRGADVTLITGPSILADPYGVRVIRIRSAEEMRQAALSHLIGQDAVIMAAAVADYRPKTAATQKIKKGEDTLTLEMERTADILTEIGKKRPPVLVGFAVETNDGLRYARDKLVRKNLDMVVYNDITQEGAGFDVDTNIVTLLHRDGREQEIPIQSKKDVADRILDEVALLFETRKTTPEHV